MTAPVRVMVREGWAVFAEGRQQQGGEVVTVPADVAELWQARGWADRAPSKAGGRSTTAGT